MDLLPFLKRLCEAPGLSGHEAPVRALIQASWAPLADEVSVDRLGNLRALKRGAGPPRASRKTIMLACHMDAIGLMVTQVQQGFLRVTRVGGIDVRVLPGQPVTVYASRSRTDLPGMVVQPPKALLPEGQGDGVVALEHLLVDVGLEADQVREQVRIGDLVSFAAEAVELGGDLLAGHSLDNRASVAGVTIALEALQGRPHTWDVVAVATAQEEVTLGGARTSAFGLRPDIAVVIDVTWGAGSGLPEHKTFKVGEGVTIGWGPNIHPALHHALAEAARQNEIPFKLEPIAQHSGTDAFAIQVAGRGIPSVVLFIPLKNMHTAVEVVSLNDVRRAGRLLAEFIAGLGDEFLRDLKWD